MSGTVVDWAAAGGVAALALGLVLTPGPNMVYLVSRSLVQGRRAGFVSLGGVGVAFAAHLVATAVGLSALFAAVPAVFTTVKVVGAAYLLHLARGVVRPGGRHPLDAPVDGPEHGSGRLFAMGLTTCLLNPKIALMYASLLPQFVDPSRPAVPQLLALGCVQIAVAVTVNACWVAAAAATARLLRGRPGLLRAHRWVSGGLLGGCAVQLALTPR